MIGQADTPYIEFWWRGEVTLPEPNLLAWARGQRLLPLLLWRAQQQGWDLPSSFVHAAP